MKKYKLDDPAIIAEFNNIYIRLNLLEQEKQLLLKELKDMTAHVYALELELDRLKPQKKARQNTNSQTPQPS